MSTADVIGDWLRTHRNDVPAPAPAEALTRLVERGAPAEIIALYAAVGADVPGLLPAIPGGPPPWCDRTISTATGETAGRSLVRGTGS